ncbi:NirD/YgiW/YdeI family stress tolerance protein [Aerosakkonemataceae cyanobacterium BLCC-F154]|uniref:NirD/YgiW/YdeI family stress tolerance protein n=1 Tax=Floridaenema fluviatile BLCC-F154 TaxID=3153640 RepID=A0ABV4YFP4_9CYAN
MRKFLILAVNGFGLSLLTGCLQLPPNPSEMEEISSSPSELSGATSPVTPAPRKTESMAFVGNTQTPVSIATLQQNSQTITISGTVKSVVGNEFTVNDGTGELIVDPGPRWWKKINVSPGEKLTVIGEFDDDELDAFKIIRSNGEQIKIRDRSGPPPWESRDD